MEKKLDFETEITNLLCTPYPQNRTDKQYLGSGQYYKIMNLGLLWKYSGIDIIEIHFTFYSEFQYTGRHMTTTSNSSELDSSVEL